MGIHPPHLPPEAPAPPSPALRTPPFTGAFGLRHCRTVPGGCHGRVVAVAVLQRAALVPRWCRGHAIVPVPWLCHTGAVAMYTGAVPVPSRCPCVPGHGPRAARVLPARCPPRQAELPQDVSPAANMTPPPPPSQAWDTPPLQAAARCPGGHSPAPHPTASTPSHFPHPAAPPRGCSLSSPSRVAIARPASAPAAPGGRPGPVPPASHSTPAASPGLSPRPLSPRPSSPPSTYLMAPGAAPAWAVSCPAGMAWHGSARPGAGVPRLCMVPRGAAGAAAGVAECRARDGGGVGGAAELRDNHSL